MRHFSHVWLLVFGLAFACSRQIEGPTPAISNTLNEVDLNRSPSVVCNAQSDRSGGWLVDVMGDNFSPIPQNVLGDAPGTILPGVSLSGPESYSLPPDRVFFSDNTKLVLQMPTKDTASAYQLAVGRYRPDPADHTSSDAIAATAN